MASTSRKELKPSQSNADASASFEQKLAELEDVVRQLEAGEKPLEESLTLYERGVAALKTCHVMLDRTEQRIRLLVKDHAGVPALRNAEHILDGETTDRMATPPPPRKVHDPVKEQEDTAAKEDSLFGQA